MTKEEARKWLEDFSSYEISENIDVILFPPFTLLDVLSSYIKINDLKIKLGAQNVSHFPKGAFTGEVYAREIKEFAEYVLIGHSERRSNFNETNEIINEKIKAAMEAKLKIIVCVSNIEQVKELIDGEYIIAFEPIEAIGTGNPENPKDVSSMISKITEIKKVEVLYGGSVDPDNVRDYTSKDNISGTLVGSESLKANSFIEIIKNAS